MYMDDILIPTKSLEENITILEQVLLTLKKYGFELNYDKCQFLKKKLEYLGYMVSDEGITLSARHTEAIKNFRRPNNAHEVQRFLALASYFRKFIKDFSIIARPLYNLLKKTVEFNFDTSCDKAYETLKEKLSSYPVLRIYNPRYDTELHTDASAIAIAGILMQKQSDGR